MREAESFLAMAAMLAASSSFLPVSMISLISSSSSLLPMTSPSNTAAALLFLKNAAFFTWSPLVPLPLSGIRREAFDGTQKDWSEQGIGKVISSWRVDLSEMKTIKFINQFDMKLIANNVIETLYDFISKRT